jgi:uncharacterized protein (DUF697 family)
VLDHAQETVLGPLRTIRKAQAQPVVLVLTCLHEAYPQQQHPLPYPFEKDAPLATSPALPEDLLRSMAEQRRRFEGLVDHCVAVDLTPRVEGFTDPDYGGPHLRQVLADLLPTAYRQTLLNLAEAQHDLQDLAAHQALPHILAYSSLAATAGALPVPLVDLLLLSTIQSRMVYDLARVYGQPMTRQRFAEIASTLGVGMLLRQGAREMIKLIPFLGPVVGSVAGGAMAGAATFALGKAFCYYYQAVHQGHVPQAHDLRRYYREQLALAQQAWKQRVE